MTSALTISAPRDVLADGPAGHGDRVEVQESAICAITAGTPPA